MRAQYRGIRAGAHSGHQQSARGCRAPWILNNALSSRSAHALLASATPLPAAAAGSRTTTIQAHLAYDLRRCLFCIFLLPLHAHTAAAT